MLPETSVSEFKDIYLRKFGVVLSDDDAREKAEALVRLYGAVYLDNVDVPELGQSN